MDEIEAMLEAPLVWDAEAQTPVGWDDDAAWDAFAGAVRV